MKLHRHAVSCDGKSYTVITLRPGAYARFSNNYYHRTWHILSDLHGARILGRLLWGLSYQRVPGTLVLIDRPNIDPSPFSAAPADPIALVPSHLTSLSERAARTLRARLPLTRPQGTVRWFTPSLEHALAAAGTVRERSWEDRDNDHRIARTGGLLTFSATPRVLRQWAVAVYRLGNRTTWHYNMDYSEIGSGYCRQDGEVQVFTDYRHRVNSASAARREIVDGLPRPPLPADVDPDIWERAEKIRHNTRISLRTFPRRLRPTQGP
jgi:hypothetical protein